MLEIYFESYGCTANHNSTEIMKGLARQSGLNITSNIDFADLIVINSCIVKQPTEEKIRRRISDLLDKNKKIILAGCMPNFISKKLREHENLFLLGTSHTKDIINLIKDIRENNYDYEKYLKKRNETKTNLPKIPENKIIGITQISEGCLGDCAYCIVRLAKGKLFSYPKEKILESVKNDLSSGCKEIFITSQDNASYGNENGMWDLLELLKEILAIEGKFYVRLGMMNPNNVLKIIPELIELYKNPRMFKFLHIPIQSGSDKVLKAMNRKYICKEIIKIVESFRKEIPDITIATDVIMGFPGETEKDFQETIEIIKKIKPEIINRSNFYPRPKTPAKKLKQLPAEIINKRSSQLQELHSEICNEIQSSWIDKEIKVLIDKKGWENTWLGRTPEYKLVAIMSKDNLLGKFINARIKKVTPHYLGGELIST
jgi:MiaB-like tRNA modifying enzyme